LRPLEGAHLKRRAPIVRSRKREGCGLFILLALASMCTLFLPSFRAYGVESESSITLERDKDKTVYTIGPGDKEQIRQDTDKAWDMLNNVVIESRGSLGKRPHNNR
jgi:hypothetical protein